MLYVNGFQQLYREDGLRDYKRSHTVATKDSSNIHMTSQNFFWHSYWLYELENDFRRLGGDYECFTLSYWDVTHDAAYWDSVDDPQIDDIPIYNSDLGGDGVKDSDNCVADEPWTVEQFPVDSLCADDEEEGSCCLKRCHVANITKTGAFLPSRSQLAEAIYTDDVNKSLDEYGDFLDAINWYHGRVHLFVGSVNYTHFSPKKGDQTTDPLFPLFHSFIEYVRLLREDCYDFDRVGHQDLDEFIPFSFEVIDLNVDSEENPEMTLDVQMDFDVLCTNPDVERLCSSRAITPRFMYDVSPNRGFGIVYELGEFWDDNEELKELCSDSLNSTWWVQTETEQDADETTEALQQYFPGTNIVVNVRSAAFVLALSMVIALLAMAASAVRADRKKDRIQGGVYGAI